MTPADLLRVLPSVDELCQYVFARRNARITRANVVLMRELIAERIALLLADVAAPVTRPILLPTNSEMAEVYWEDQAQRITRGFVVVAELVANRITGATQFEQSIPMILHCPECSTRHIDAGVFATRAHYTHACQHCGFVWRPAIVSTVGVQFLPGFKDEP